MAPIFSGLPALNINGAILLERFRMMVILGICRSLDRLLATLSYADTSLSRLTFAPLPHVRTLIMKHTDFFIVVHLYHRAALFRYVICFTSR